MVDALRQYTQLNIQVVEKQSLINDTRELLKEAQTLQALTHKNIQIKSLSP